MSIQNYFIFLLGIIIPPLLLINSNIQVIGIDDIKNISILYSLIIFFSLTLNIFLFKFFRLNFLNIVLYLTYINFFTNKIIFNSQLITFKDFLVLNLISILMYFISIYFLKKNKKLINFKKFFIYTFSIYIFFTLINLTLDNYKNMKLITKKSDIFYNSSFDNLNLSSKPDIIHIIPDSLLNLSGLAQAGYDTKKMEQTYKNLGIKIFNNSISNYPRTHFALASYLNGSIIKKSYEWEEKDLYKYIQNSKLHNNLIKNGYQIEWYETRWLGSRCKKKDGLICANKNFFDNEFFNTLFQSFNINTAWITKLHYKLFNKTKITLLDVLTNNIDKYEVDKPRYFFGYLELPHPPYKVMSDCKSTVIHYSNSNNILEKFNKKQYLEQVDCFNLQLVNLVKKLNNRGKEYILLIQSDTGHYLYGYDKIPSQKNTYDYPSEVYQSFFAVSENVKCFDNKNQNIFYNVEAFNILFNCLNKKKKMDKLINRNKFYSIYHHDHQKYGKIYLNKNLN